MKMSYRCTAIRLSMLLLLCFGVLSACHQVSLAAKAQVNSPIVKSATYASDRIIIKFKNRLQAMSVTTQNQGKIVAQAVGNDAVLVKIPNGTTVTSQIAKYKLSKDVEFVEPDYIYQATYTPNDTNYATQWHLPAMNVPQAWDTSKGSNEMIIAIVDTGVDADHPDLKDKLLPGYNYLSGNTNTDDDNGHGTHVAGIAAAITDNGIGVAGACITCKILPMKVLDATGSGSTYHIGNAIKYAVSEGAKVINLSLGGPYYSSYLQDAVNFAFNQGVLVVAAAGNSGSSTPLYPAAFDNVISVASLDSSGNRSYYSNYGDTIDLAAPGSFIYSTTNDGSYGYMSGTSMASPNVAGVAALIWSHRASMSNQQIEQLLKSSATDLGASGFDAYYGYGSINAYQAIQNEPDTTAPTAPTSLSATAKTTTSIRFNWTPSTDNKGVKEYLVYSAGNQIATTNEMSFTATGLVANSLYQFSVKARDLAGNLSPMSSVLTVRTENNGPFKHTIVFDGKNDFYFNGYVSGNETFSTSSSNYFSAVTWDDQFVYVGYTGEDVRSTTLNAGNKWILLYFGGEGGTDRGVSYNGQTANLPFKAKYHVRWKVDGTFFNRLEFNKTGWFHASTYPSTSWFRNGNYVELRIPRAELGNPQSLQMISMMINEKTDSQWSWGMNPAAGFTDGFNKQPVSFHEFDFKSTLASAAQFYNYEFKLSGQKDNTASFSWRELTGAESIKLQGSTDGGLTWTDIQTSAPLLTNSTKATAIQLQGKTAYKFRLAVNGGLYEGSSSIVNVFTGLADQVPPTSPSNLKLISKTKDSIGFSWTAATDNVGVVRYDVFVNAVLYGSTADTSFLISGLKAGTTYALTVQAWDAAPWGSAISTPLTVTTEALISAYSHTIAIDGNNDFRMQTAGSGNETFATSSSNYFSYVTMDENNLYFGYSGADISSTTTDAANKWILVYVGGDNGTTQGVTYGAQTPKLPFQAKFHFRWKVDGTRFSRLVFDGQWKEVGTYNAGSWSRKGNYVEFTIPRADIGNPRSVQWVSFMINDRTDSQWTWGSNPGNAVLDGFNKNFNAFHEYDLSSRTAPAAQVYAYNFQLTSTINVDTNFSFNKPVGATSVEIQLSADQGATWKKANTTTLIDGNSNFATVLGLSKNTSYKFRLFVIGGSLDGSSSIVNVYLPDSPPVDTQPPTTPTNLTLISKSTNAVTIGWSASSDNIGVTGYDVFLGSRLLATISETSYFLSGLAPSTEYTFSVRAKDAAGNPSSMSPVLTVRTDSLPTSKYAHTIVLDGNNDFYNSFNLRGNETFSTSSTNYFSYITWDQQYVYIGYSGADIAASTTDASKKWVLMYFGGNNGSTKGITYNQQTPTLPFQAKYHVRWKVDGTYFNRQVFNGTWAEGGTYSTSNWARKNNFMELRIPRSDIGNPSTLQIVTFMINERTDAQWSWAASPSNGFSDGFNRSFGVSHEFDFSAETASAAQVYNYDFRITSAGANSLTVGFKPMTDAQNVTIQQSVDEGLNWIPSTTTSPLTSQSTSATVTGLATDKRYKFRFVVTGGPFAGSSAIANKL